jgi:hypothetical protein
MIDMNELYNLKESVLNARLELERLEWIVKNLSDEERKAYDTIVLF